MAKLNKFADKVKKIKRTATVDFPTDGGEVISFKVESISQNTMHTFRWYWWFHSIILSINRFHGILTISFKVESISQNTMEAINRKYDGMEPPVPTKRVPAKGGRMKIVENPDDPK